ncbi:MULTISPECIES: hypothetical protein [unclassified Nonomuraea]|uniref:hypothetical protein n=1 Tax=unclassified Nonomuraea TaxID=2593643 RepID=UPI0033C675BF
MISLEAPPAPDAAFALSGWTCSSLTPQVVWNAGLRVIQAQLDGRVTRRAWVLVDGEPDPAPELMPRTDGSEDFRRWFSRVRASRSPDTPILLYVRDIVSCDRSFYEIVLSAVRGLPGADLLPRHGSDVEFFCGDYQRTPGGIHREYCSNRHLVLAGAKSMHFWTGQAWIPEDAGRMVNDGPFQGTEEEYLSSLGGQEEDVRASLTAAAGQAFLWDNGVWHVGETHGLAFAVNISSFMSSYDAAERAFPLEVSPAGEVSPAWLAAFSAYLGRRTDRDTALAVASAHGITGAEPVRSAATPSSRVRSATHARILWCRDGHEVIVATHGKAIRFPATVGEWLREAASLPAGAACDVPDEEEIGRLAAWLVGNSAFCPA